MNKKVIYTAIIDDYDSLKDPHYINEDYDYICFTDQDFKSKVWKIVDLPIEIRTLSFPRINRCLKWLPHRYLSQYDFSIYIDGSVQLLDDANILLEHNQEHKPITLLSHNKRTNIWDEFYANFIQKKDEEMLLQKTFERYVDENVLQNHHNLYHQCVLMRYHNDDRTIKFDESVWDMICNYTFRDQLITPYIIEKYGIEDWINILPKGVIDRISNYAVSYKHTYTPY